MISLSSPLYEINQMDDEILYAFQSLIRRRLNIQYGAKHLIYCQWDLTGRGKGAAVCGDRLFYGVHLMIRRMKCLI
jgi:hypothetical protein